MTFVHWMCSFLNQCLIYYRKTLPPKRVLGELRCNNIIFIDRIGKSADCFQESLWCAHVEGELYWWASFIYCWSDGRRNDIGKLRTMNANIESTQKPRIQKLMDHSPSHCSNWSIVKPGCRGLFNLKFLLTRAAHLSHVAGTECTHVTLKPFYIRFTETSSSHLITGFINGS